MECEKCINPTREQFKALMAQDYKGPIMMINLLKYKKDGGRESYEKYETGALSNPGGGR